MAGALNTTGMVYCMTEKNGTTTAVPTVRILQDTTTTTTTDSNTTTTTDSNATVTPAAPAVDEWA